METIEYRYYDKSKWGDGPWMNEPDKIQFTDAATGLPCLIVRNRGGALCGYVGVAEGHRYFGLDYSRGCPEKCEKSTSEHSWCDHTADAVYDVHGGLTFSDFCRESPDHHGICHVPGPGEPERVWWLGFDCAHGWDYSPGIDARMREIAPDLAGRGPDETYKDVDYVRNECAKLAAQLAASIP